MGKVIDFETFRDGFEILVDEGKSNPVTCAVLMFPNATQVTIKGDPSIVKQVVNRLDGIVVEYEPTAQPPKDTE